jgi:hypothetical protein
MTLDTLLQALGYPLLLVVMIALWVKSVRQPESRRFWTLLALAWTMNLLGNVAWIVHDLVTSQPLDNFSPVDIFYVAHYALIAAALWRTPASLPRRAGWWIASAMFVVNAIVWMVCYAPAMSLRGGPWTNFLGVAMYPVLDAGLVTLAALRYLAARRSTWERLTLLMLCAMMCYALANTLNMIGYVYSTSAVGFLPTLFWLLTDVFMLFVVLSPQPQTTPPSM